jgi:hypothetical protein
MFGSQQRLWPAELRGGEASVIVMVIVLVIVMEIVMMMAE